MKNKRRLRVELKEISTEGYFEGILSPYGNVDTGGDVVEFGAYRKSLNDQGTTRPLLWQHGPKDPIGLLTLEDRPDGLWCKGQLLMEDDLAKKAYRFIKAGIVKGLSIGFEAIKDSIEGGVRHLKEIKLYEGSIVTFPMNESALITSVKGFALEAKGDFNEELNEIQLGDSTYQMRAALSSALSSIFYEAASKEESLADAETIIQQFRDAYMAFLPSYLDLISENYGGYGSWKSKILETKSGRKISAATMDTLKSAHQQMKSGLDMIYALCSDEADGEDADTLKAKAATEVKPKPVTDHLAADTALVAATVASLKARLLPAA